MWIFEEDLELLEKELDERQRQWIESWADYVAREEDGEE